MKIARVLVGVSVSLLAIAATASTNNWPNNLVSGSVTFKGMPLAGVRVTAYNTNTSTITQLTTTDENGNYSLQLPAWINTDGTASADYHIWVNQPGYGFYPSVPAGATITRADHTGDFQGNHVTDIAIYLTVVHYVALPNLANRGIAGPPLMGVNFFAYDGSNPLITLPPSGVAALRTRALVASTRFSDNQDGTITDSLTGLVWLKNAGCFGTANWADALAQVNALASGACGLSDGSAAGQWRLPNINELESLVDVSASNPAVSPGNPFTNVSNKIYWSSTSYFGGQAGSANAWAIRFSDGRWMNDLVSNVKSKSYNEVWAVKGAGGGEFQLQATGQYVTYVAGDDGSIQSGIPFTYPRFLDKSDGTVVDTVTGLVWLKQADCIKETWAAAISAVGALASGQCGLTDGSMPGTWRMPSRTELLSLSDRNENNHADFFDHTYLNLDGSLYQSAIFSNFIPYQYYWTSATDTADISQAWTVFSCDFGVYEASKANAGYTLAVRSARLSDLSRRGTVPPRERGGSLK